MVGLNSQIRNQNCSSLILVQLRNLPSMLYVAFDFFLILALAVPTGSTTMVSGLSKPGKMIKFKKATDLIGQIEILSVILINDILARLTFCFTLGT